MSPILAMPVSFLRIVGALVLCCGLAACAGLPAQSYVSPRVNGKTYDGFLAYGAFSDLAVEGAFEQAMCDRLRAAGHACETMLEAAPPTAPQNGASRHRAALGSGAQAVITIELADPTTASRRILAGGRPGYRVSVVDTATQKVVARIAVEGQHSDALPGRRGRALAKAVVHALKHRKLLTQRP